MSEALIVLNPRQIPACITAIKALDIPTCWLSYMTEGEAAHWANQQIAATAYDRYLILSDDTIPTPTTLDLILETADAGHPVVTGYSNLDENQNLHIVNLATNPLPPPPPAENSYHLMTRGQAEQHNGLIPTTFAGLSLTLLTRPTALRFPLQITTLGGQMDYDLSYRLAQADIPIVAPVGAYVHHVKERWCYPDQNPQKRLLVGQRRPSVQWTNVPVPA